MLRRRLPLALLLATFLATGALALEGTYGPPADPPTAEPVHLTNDLPVSVVEVARDGTVVFGGLAGPVWRLDPGAAEPRVIASPPVIRGPEWGLVGLALAPDFAETGDVFIAYTTGPEGTDPGDFNVSGVARVARVHDGKETVVYEYPATRFHNSGRLLIHDDLLYLSRGEQNVRMQAQDPKNQAGKILRMTLDGKPAPGNPAEEDSRFDPFVYSYGHRNPFGLGWDLDRGTLVESEVGNSANEEINVITPGKNYGWPHCEGTKCVKDVGSEAPLVVYPKVITPTGLAVVGADYYTGSFNYGEVRRVYETPAGWTDEVYYDHARGLVVDVERSWDGTWIYVGAWDGLWRIPAHPASVASLATTRGPEDEPPANPAGSGPAPTPPPSPTPPATQPAFGTAPTNPDLAEGDTRAVGTAGVLIGAIASATAVIAALFVLRRR